MSFSQTLEVAIGLILVYYILGSIVSWITKMILEAQQTRGRVLEDYLRQIAGDKTVDLTSLPQMKALQPIRYKNFLGVFGANTEPKMIEKVPVGTLVDAFFDISGLADPTVVDAAALKDIIGALPESDGKQAMLKWIDQGVDSVNGLRARASAYFTGILDQAADKFKANARSFVILLSIAITLILGTDSIQLAKDLWTNAEFRAMTAGQAEILVQQGGELDIDQIIAELDTLSIVKLTWWQLDGALPGDATGLDWAGFLALKFLGLGLTVLAVSQGSSFWYDLLKKLTTPAKSSSSSSSVWGGTTSTSTSESG